MSISPKLARIALVGVAINVFAMATVSSAQAGSASGSLSVSAAVVNSCSVSNAVLPFGTVNPTTGASLTANTNILVLCTLGTTFSVALGTGQNASGSQRRMKGTLSNGLLAYNLYQDSAGQTPFGSVAGQTLTGQTGLGATANIIPVYGSIPSGQSAVADAYTDTVPITVSY